MGLRACGLRVDGQGDAKTGISLPTLVVGGTTVISALFCARFPLSGHPVTRQNPLKPDLWPFCNRMRFIP